MGEYNLYVCEFQSSETAEAGTNTTTINVTGHGLVTYDMIVNTTRRGRTAERGCRLINEFYTDNTIYIDDAITGQTSGDTIRLYKFVDRTGILRPGTFRLNRRGAGQSDLSFEIKTDSTLILVPGQQIRVKYTNDALATTYQFWGVVASTSRKPVFDGSTDIFQTVNCQGMSQVPTRRNIRIDYTAGTTCGSIVTDMIEDYLFQEGIRQTTIDTGASLEEDWQSDVISIAEVLDQCASLSGCMWFIDDEGFLQFYQDDGSISDAVHDVDSNWTDYTNLEFSQDISNYTNKVFIAGGSDETGNDILINSENFTESSAMQNLTAGTGVYGNITRDTSIVESDYKTAETGSTTTAINITSHGQVVGDMVWNYTQDEYRQVLTTPTADQFTVDAFSSVTARTSDTAEAGTSTTTIVMTGHGLSVGQLIYNSTRSAYRFVLRVDDANTITVEAVASQASGDTILRGGDIIVFFDQANDIISNTLKKQGTLPETISFDTSELDFLPLTKLYVDLPEYGAGTSYYLIEDVEVFDKGYGLVNCWAKIKGSKRTNSNFSTQRVKNSYDFWRDR